MMTRDEAIEFARASALEAIDQAGAYDDTVGVYRDNVVDTHSDECDQTDYGLRDDMLAVFGATLRDHAPR